MEGLRHVVVGSAFGGLLGAAAFFAVDGLMPSAVDAVPTHLTCEETTSTKNGEPFDLDTYTVFVDPDTGQATKGGSAMKLTASSDTLLLLSDEREKGEYIDSMSIQTFTINRSDLTFNRRWTLSMHEGYKSLVRMPTRTYRYISSGQCQITKMPAGNKI